MFVNKTRVDSSQCVNYLMTLVKHILAFGATRDNRNPTIPTSQLGKSMLLKGQS